MATGLIALLDDVAALAKLAAASLDDVAAQTAKASAKAAGVVIDDAAVTPTYVVGLSPSRELPIIWRIGIGSLRNKLLFLLPLCLLLGYFAPWAITPLLMLGGIYLCFEGAEKVYEAVIPHAHVEAIVGAAPVAPAMLEQEKVSGAIRTDFILSAEIMALTLAGVSSSNVYTQGAVLVSVGILITVAVYGVVAFIVKADDIGLHLAERRSAAPRVIGRLLVKGVPVFLRVLATIGTAAMLWVGGSIVIHGLAELGIHGPEYLVEEASHVGASVGGPLSAVGEWAATAATQAVAGILLGAVAIVVVALSRMVLLRFGYVAGGHQP